MAKIVWDVIERRTNKTPGPKWTAWFLDYHALTPKKRLIRKKKRGGAGRRKWPPPIEASLHVKREGAKNFPDTNILPAANSRETPLPCARQSDFVFSCVFWIDMLGRSWETSGYISSLRFVSMFTFINVTIKGDFLFLRAHLVFTYCTSP